ncbi:Zim17-type zinc finger protein [Rhynchospora pubera]|uniref:Zim17-type zinc finger protein n=1 Tax=Rhynchospora pubera TaxID=906938 RepID=A0AAV8G1T0_9POAL|nr:Zim17-type zinc finger protein [Rhynchospora pubera]
MEAVVDKISLVSFVHSDHLHTNFSRNHGLSFVHAPAARRSFPKLQISNSRRTCGIIACLNGRNAKNDLDPSQSTSNAEEARIDIGLPRRSLLVKFTCDACGERTSRFINRIAYEKGTVFLQCGGCQVYHKFVDNLGLIVEYDLREDKDGDVN